MCGGDLIFSEGTHDLCCARNPYESMSGEEWEASAALHEGRAGYGEGAAEGDAGRLYIYKVWGEGEGGNLRFARWAATEHGHKSADAADVMQDAGSTIQDDTEENEVRHRAEVASAVGADDMPTSDTPVKTHKGLDKGNAHYNPGGEALAGEGDRAQTSATPIKGHSCVFAVSFTESGRFGTLWSMRTVHSETNYFSLTRLLQKIEKRLRNGEPLAENSPNPPKKREKSAAAKLAFRFGIEEEDVYSIRFSTETVKRLALFYCIPERDVRRIREAEVGEE
jgi:hypothetical protein